MAPLLVPIVVGLGSIVLQRGILKAFGKPLVELVARDGVRLYGSAVLALGTCAVATVVTSFTYALGLLCASAVYLGLVLPRAVRYWFRHRSDRGARSLKATAAIVAMTVYFWTIGVLWFSSGTHRFAVHGWLGFDANAAPSLFRFLNLFLFHFAEMIPIVDVTKTARWSEPLALGHPALGAFILAFKILIIVPVLAAAKGIWAAFADGGRPSRTEAAEPAEPRVAIPA
jgi:hypothetical protein